ncbi:MAG: hypothetical protein ABIR15_01255 [Chitinophagaceae bacterium]
METVFCQEEHGAAISYNGYWKQDASKFNTSVGYSKHIVAKESFIADSGKTYLVSGSANFRRRLYLLAFRYSTGM